MGTDNTLGFVCCSEILYVFKENYSILDWTKAEKLKWFFWSKVDWECETVWLSGIWYWEYSGKSFSINNHITVNASRPRQWNLCHLIIWIIQPIFQVFMIICPDIQRFIGIFRILLWWYWPNKLPTTNFEHKLLVSSSLPHKRIKESKMFTLAIGTAINNTRQPNLNLVRKRRWLSENI